MVGDSLISDRQETTAGTRPSVRWALLLFALALGSTGMVAWFVEPLDPASSCCDMLYYRSMSFNYFNETRPDLNEPPLYLDQAYSSSYFGRYMHRENRLNRQPPYVYRPVTPLVARLISYPLPGDIDDAFRVLTFAALALASFVMAITVLELSANIFAAIASIAVFASMFRLTEYYLWNYAMTDPLAYLFLAAGVYFMLRRNDAAFFAVAFLAVFNKEFHLFLLASYFLMQVYERRLTRFSIASYLVILGSYIVFRLAMPVPNDAYTLANAYTGVTGLETIFRFSLIIFGVLTFFTLSRIWLVDDALWLLPLAGGGLVTALFSPDRERVFIYAFPLVFVAVFGLRVTGLRSALLAATPGALFLGFRLLDILIVDWRLLVWTALYLVSFAVVETALFMSQPQLLEQLLELPHRGRVALSRPYGT